MGGWFRGRTKTQELTTPAYRVERGRPGFRAALALLAVAVAVAGVYTGMQFIQRYLAPAKRVVELEAENLRLAEQLTSARMQAELDAATRAELERQLAELTAKVKELNQELGFYKRAQPAKQ